MKLISPKSDLRVRLQHGFKRDFQLLWLAVWAGVICWQKCHIPNSVCKPAHYTQNPGLKQEKYCENLEERGVQRRERENKTWIITMNLPTPPPSHPMLQQSTVLTMGLLNTDTHNQNSSTNPTNHRNAPQKHSSMPGLHLKMSASCAPGLG